MKRIVTLTILALLFLAAGNDAWGQRRNNRGRNTEPQTVENTEVIDNFRRTIEQSPYLSKQAMAELNDEVTQHIDKLKNWKDRDTYISDNNLSEYLEQKRNTLEEQQKRMPALIDEFLGSYKDIIIVDSAACRDSLVRIVNERLGQLETNLNRLEREMDNTDEPEAEPLNWTLIGIIAGGLLLFIIIMLVVRSSKKKPTPYVPQNNNNTNNVPPSNDPGIVVRRKTATILKKQSLEDVMDNPNYLKVDLEDCCFESAVRRMYLKNQCVADIYDMYARDLEHPEQAREYGCMVLGRWVYDSESDEYYVSLEQVVLPGEDAVFEEYELNFGGKIKLKVHETLRRLRRDTNLQYDLTCWVHSHPGLTVFFSNSDTSVQDQLKHPQHPNFLTALVIDTLTPRMETGIFTYHRDKTLNSKNDLKKLYSLKEWYDWARKSLKENATSAPQPSQPSQSAQPVQPVQLSPTFNALASAKEHTTACYGIELTKDSVLDLCMALGSQPNGIAGTLHCNTRKEGPATVYVAERLSNQAKEDDLQPAGCFVVTSHFSLPTVRKAMGDTLEKFRFVLVYTTSDGRLTSVPVMGSDLCADESYYGEQSIDELRQWTKKS